eukprot:TRINITY_DN2154_c2_g1_i1.p1 TRINITY_DN2154_c2_g1~~TRINITY_DN2154_c2_g1_i1.p1  ORF type:complete len:971 (+),score=227.39 TRINITY_DN2154_c2_g1_i1:79-2991(+)
MADPTLSVSDDSGSERHRYSADSGHADLDCMGASPSQPPERAMPDTGRYLTSTGTERDISADCSTADASSDCSGPDYVPHGRQRTGSAAALLPATSPDLSRPPGFPGLARAGSGSSVPALDLRRVRSAAGDDGAGAPEPPRQRQGSFATSEEQLVTRADSEVWSRRGSVSSDRDGRAELQTLMSARHAARSASAAATAAALEAAAASRAGVRPPLAPARGPLGSARVPVSQPEPIEMREVRLAVPERAAGDVPPAPTLTATRLPGLAKALPIAKEHAVRSIQRLWRGYYTRKDLEIIYRQGRGTCKDLERLRLIRTVFKYRESPPRVAGIRHLPMGPVGAYLATPPDSSATRIRLRDSVRLWCLKSGSAPGSSGAARSVLWLGFVAVWMLLTAGAIYLIPGWVALSIKLVFQEGHSTLRTHQFVTWIMLFALVCSIGIAVQHVLLSVEQEKLTQRLDSLFAVIAKKNAGMLSLSQLQQIRGADLGATKAAVYFHAPLTVFHGVHVVMAVVTILVFSWRIGLAVLLWIVLMAAVSAMYDRLVHSQQQLLHTIAQREGRFYTVSVDHLSSQLQPAPAQADRNGWTSPDVTAQAGGAAPRRKPQGLRTRDYQLVVAKSLMRMHRTYARVHWATFATVVLLAGAFPVLLFHLGGTEVSAGRLARHDLVFCLCYTVFAFASAVQCNGHAAQVLLARAPATRCFKLAWHFRDYSDRRTFFERECAVVYQVQGGVVQKDQTPSVGLAVVVGIMILCLATWLGIFASEMDFQCTDLPVNCTAQFEDGRGLADVGQVYMAYGFDFFEGCSPTLPVLATLRKCAQAVVRANNDAGLPTYLPNGANFTASISYEGWRGPLRGVSKRFYVGEITIGNTLYADVCPDPRLAAHPFRDTFELLDHPRSSLGFGYVHPIHYENVPQVFYKNRDYLGCYGLESEPPPGVCATFTPGWKNVHSCWCEEGQPRPYTFDQACRCMNACG